MKTKLIATFLLFLFCHISTLGQEPYWIKNTPQPTNNTFRYIKEWGEGSTTTKALNQAMAKALFEAAKSIGVSTTTEDVRRAITESNGDYSVVSQKLKIPHYKICEHIISLSKNRYKVWVLVQTGVNIHNVPDYDYSFECSKSDYSSGGALLRSVVVPSWGQFYGNHKVNGGIIIAGTVLTGAAALVANSKANGFYDDALKKQGLERSLLLDDYNKWNDIKTYSFIGLGVIYAYNIVTAVAIKPKERKIAFVPNYDITNNAMALIINIKL